METITQSKPIKIMGADIQDNILKISLEDHTAQTRVHMYMSQFIPEAPKNFANEFRNAISESFSKSEYYFQQWHNFYMDNRELGDELRYVFERRNLDRYTGNTLEKPKLLLKRLFISDT